MSGGKNERTNMGVISIEEADLRNTVKLQES